MPRGAPIPGNLDARSRTEPPNFDFEIFCIDSKSQEPVKLLSIGGGKYSIEKSNNDFQLKAVLTNQILIRGTYRYLTIAVFADSPKFHRAPATGRDSKTADTKSAKDVDSDSTDDDFYDEWAYCKNIRDIHGDKIYPITYDSDLPKSDSDEEQEPRMALPLAPPTLPDNIKVLASDKKEKEKERLEKKDFWRESNSKEKFLTCNRSKSMMKQEKNLRKHPKLTKGPDLWIFHNWLRKNYSLFI